MNMASDSDVRQRNESDRTELSEFQYTILFSLAERPRYGLELKSRMTEFYGSEINHGRLYPNLNDLVEMGLLSKSKRDNRTNEYALSERGLMMVLDRIGWGISALVDDEEIAADLRRRLEEAIRESVEESSTA